MPVKSVVIWPDPILSTRAKPVTEFGTDALKALVQDMLDTCSQVQGLGLAANQIGISLAVIVVDDSEEQDGREMRVFCNPQFSSAYNEKTPSMEGCLSVPGEAHEVERFCKGTVTAQTPEGQTMVFEVSDRRAAAYQHEIDHLEGRVYVEYLGSMRRDIIRRKMTKMKKYIDAQRHEVAERMAFAEAHSKLTEAKAKALVAEQPVMPVVKTEAEAAAVMAEGSGVGIETK